MLQLQTVDDKTLDLLTRIQSNPYFAATRLVGGTALALQIGHRKSIDLDLFGMVEINSLELNQELQAYGTLVLRNSGKRVHQFTINGIHLDIVQYDYPWLEAEICEHSVRLAAMPDIAAMKLAAITNRGTKKDFIDLAFLLSHFSLSQMLSFYRQKFNDGSEFLVIKSLVYFDDADEEPMPYMLSPITWEDACARITQAVAQIKTLVP